MVHPELSWRPKHTLRATKEAKFENLTFLSYSFHFLLHRNIYMLLKFIFEEGMSKIQRPELELISGR